MVRFGPVAAIAPLSVAAGAHLTYATALRLRRQAAGRSAHSVTSARFLSFNRFRECRVEIADGLAIELRALRNCHR
jgi:hypothetical protein